MVRRWLGSWQQAQTGSPRLIEENLYKAVWRLPVRPTGRLRNMQHSWGLLHLPTEDDRAVSFWHYLKPVEEREGPILLDLGASYCGWIPACTPASVLPPVLEKGVFSRRMSKQQQQVKIPEQKAGAVPTKCSACPRLASFMCWRVQGGGLLRHGCAGLSVSFILSVTWKCVFTLAVLGTAVTLGGWVWLLPELSVTLVDDGYDHVLYCHSKPELCSYRPENSSRFSASVGQQFIWFF